MSDSQSALYSCNKMSTKARYTRRGRMLRQISSCLLAHPNMRVCLGFIDGASYPADKYSRIFHHQRVPWSGFLSSDDMAKCVLALQLITWKPHSPMLPQEVPAQRQLWC